MNDGLFKCDRAAGKDEERQNEEEVREGGGSNHGVTTLVLPPLSRCTLTGHRLRW